jgi:hypothetical protein
VTLAALLSSDSDGIVAIVRVTVTDPQAELTAVEFYTTLTGAQQVGPFAPDRLLSHGVYEYDLLLDAVATTEVAAVLKKADNTLLQTSPATLTLPARSTTPPAPALGALNVVPGWSGIEISVVPAAAFAWKCWMRAGAWPTADGTADGVLLDDYLRFEAHRDTTRFSCPTAIPGVTWYVIAAGFGQSGVMGARLADSVETTASAPARPSLKVGVDLDVLASRNIVKWTPNEALLQLESEAGAGTHSVEVFRAGQPASLGRALVSALSVPDTAVDPCSDYTGCEHRMYEYRVLLTDNRDGAELELATSISGPYQN